MRPPSPSRALPQALLYALLGFPAVTYAQAFNWEWAQNVNPDGISGPAAMRIDAEGNTYVCGDFQGVMELNDLAIESFGEKDIYVAKFAPDGTPLWLNGGGGAYVDRCNGMDIDDEGHVYLTGIVGFGPATFGDEMVTGVGSDIIVLRVDADGTFAWARRYGSSANAFEEGTAIGTVTSGEVYVTGYFRDTLAVDGLPDVIACTGDEYQGMLLKLTADGDALWSRQLMCPAGPYARVQPSAMAIGPNDELYVGGGWRGTEAMFDTDTLVNYDQFMDGLAQEGFIARYTAQGDELWVQHISGDEDDAVRGLATDHLGNCYMIAHRNGSTVLDDLAVPYTGSFSPAKILVAKFDPQGTALWGRWVGDSPYTHEVFALAVSEQDKLYIGGRFTGGCSFGTIELTFSFGSTYHGLYLAEYDTDGTVLQVLDSRHSQMRMVGAIACDALGGLAVGGYFQDTITFGDLPQLQGGTNAFFLLRSGDLANAITPQAATTLAPVFPNPTAGRVYLPLDRRTSIIVRDVAGAIALRRAVQPADPFIDLSALPNGAYSIVYTVNSRTRLAHVIVAH